jgi:hypothetical protein
MSLLRRIQRNKAKETLARGGHPIPISYAKRALDGMTRGLRALTRAGVQGTNATQSVSDTPVAPGEAAE